MSLKKFLYVFSFIGFFLCKEAVAQKTIVTAEGTLHDKFGKKIGNLMFSVATLKLGRVKNNAIKSDTIRIYNSGMKRLNLAIGKFPAHLSLNLKSSVIEPNTESWIAVAFDAQKKNDYGFVLDRFELVTDDSVQSKKSLSVTATLEEAFRVMSAEDSADAPKSRWNESVFDFGQVKQGDKITHEFIVYNDGKKDLLIHKAKSNCSCLKTVIQRSVVAPGDSCLVKVDFDSSGKEGKDSHKIDVYLNDYMKPDMTIEMKGEIVK